jgi:hypothetical protein
LWLVKDFQLKKLIIYLVILILSTSICRAQTWLDNITPAQPKSPKENTAQLFGGLAMQLFGIGIVAGSAYVMVLEPDLGEIPVYGLTIGTGFTVVGSGLIIRSISNMVIARKSIHDFKKKQKQKDVSLYLGPTQYGVGIVCAF